MNKAISNIGIPQDHEDCVYRLMKKYGYTGLEIAPSKFIGDRPYEKLAEVQHKAQRYREKYGLEIASMQSLWYGISGNIFFTEQAEHLYDYTEKAARFAHSVNCKNLVLGSPKNRSMPIGFEKKDALGFFTKIVSAAALWECNIALEANPKVYGTNFINTSDEAFDFAKQVPGLKVNYDVGTVIINGEELKSLSDNIDLVSHIHISENALAPVARRSLHKELCALLKEKNYSGFVSIEMKDAGVRVICEVAEYVAEVFN